MSNPTTPADFSPPERSSRSFTLTKWLVLIILTLVVGVLDQWSKHWAQIDLQQRERGRITVVEDYFAFSYVRNPGAAWGFLARAEESFRQPFFITISLVALLFILYIHYRLEPGQWLMLIAISMVMGGAVGNSIDRFRFKYVIDFIELHYQNRYRWPTFNVADIAITIGVILLFWEMFFGTGITAQRRQSSAPKLAKPDEAVQDNHQRPPSQQ